MEHSDVLERVRNLMELANHPETPDGEADNARAMASKIMLKHAIDEAELEATRPAEERSKPEFEIFTVCAPRNPLWRQMADLAGYVADHCRLRSVYYGTHTEGRHGISIGVVGYMADIRFFEMLFTSLVLQMGTRLEPKPDTSKSLAENVYLLHEAGVKWQRMAHLINEAAGKDDLRQPLSDRWWDEKIRRSKDQPNVLIPWPDGHRLINLYRKYCREIGETPHAITSPVAYQRNFVEAFGLAVMRRFYEMERNSGPGTALAIRSEAIDGKYNELFPDIGKKKPRKRKDLRYEHEAYSSGTQAGREADLGGTKMGDANKRALE